MRAHTRTHADTQEVQFQLDLVSAGVRQGRGLCQKLHRLVGPPHLEVDVTDALPRTSAMTMGELRVLCE